MILIVLWQGLCCFGLDLQFLFSCPLAGIKLIGLVFHQQGAKINGTKYYEHDTYSS
jgi:hypothetical protein